MSHKLWPVVECYFPNEQSLKSTMDRFACRSIEEDFDAHLGGRQKELYRFITRKEAISCKESLYSRRTTEEEI